MTCINNFCSKNCNGMLSSNKYQCHEISLGLVVRLFPAILCLRTTVVSNFVLSGIFRHYRKPHLTDGSGNNCAMQVQHVYFNHRIANGTEIFSPICLCKQIAYIDQTAVQNPCLLTNTPPQLR